MARRYMNDRVKLLTLTVLLMFVISTASTKQCTPTKTDGGDYVIRNIGIKLCQVKCAEHGQFVSIEYDIETLTCRLLRDESKIEKEGHAIPAESHSHVPTGSCTSSISGVGQRCLKTRSGKEVCVQASTTDASEDLTPTKTVPPAPVTALDSDRQATLSAADLEFFSACDDGDLEKVKRILAAGHVNINTLHTRSGNMTAVMMATAKGHRDVVEFLIFNGADLSVAGGNNILHMACIWGELKIVKLILSLKVLDINAKTVYGYTAADYARRGLHQQVLDLLVSHGAH